MTSRAGIDAGRAVFRFNADTDPYVRAIKIAEARLRSFGQRARQIGSGLTRTGALITAAFALPTGIFAGFDDRMRVVRAVTGATQKDFEALTEEAKRLGRTTSFSASQVAEGMAELGRAGFNPAEILQSTEAVLALSRATSTELPRAAEIAGAALRGFGLPAEDMGRVADVLTQTANGSAQTLDDLAEAMKPVAPLASLAGASIEDTAAAIAVLANNGIKGSLAGNSLARAYKNLSASTTQTKLAEFGVSAVDSAGNLRPLADIINELAKATNGLGTAARLELFETLFGRGQAAALTLAKSATAFDDIRDKIRDSAGVAIKTAEEMDAGIGGSFRKLFSAVEGIAIAIGEAIQVPVQIIANVVSQIAGTITEWVSSNRALVATIAGVGVALLAAGGIITGIGLAATAASFALGGLATAIGAVGTVFAVLTSPITIVIGLILGVVGAALYMSGAVDAAVAAVTGAFEGLKAQVGDTVIAIRDALLSGDFETAGELIGELFSVGLDLAKAKALGVLNDLRDAATEKAIETGTNLRYAWTNALAGVRGLLVNFQAFMAGIWEKITTGVAKAIGTIIAKFDPSITSAEVVAELDAELGRNLSDIEKKRQGRQDDIARNQLDAIKNIDAQEKAALGAANAFNAPAEALIDGLEQGALNRLKDLQEKARGLNANREADDAAKGTDQANRPGALAGIPDLPQVAADGVQRTLATFRAAEASQFGARSATAQIAASVDEINDTLKEIRDKPSGLVVA